MKEKRSQNKINDTCQLSQLFGDRERKNDDFKANLSFVSSYKPAWTTWVYLKTIQNKRPFVKTIGSQNKTECHECGDGREMWE